MLALEASHSARVNVLTANLDIHVSCDPIKRRHAHID